MQVLTSAFCRELFTSLGFAYDDIRHCDLDALQGYIAIECARSHRAGMTPHFMTPRRKSDSLCCKMKPEGGLEKAYIKIDCLDQWNGREAISFNSEVSSASVDGPTRRIANRFSMLFDVG